MDQLELRKKAAELFGKYKYGLLILALGLILMCLPSGKTEDSSEEIPPQATEQADPASELEQILSQIEGVGKVKVMLTRAKGEEVYYQADTDQSEDTLRSDTVIITDADRAQSGLIRRTDPPTYLGAIVVCQGAERPSVCLAVVEAVGNVTGLSSDRISVLKMK